jgi:hypothetical protein
MKKIFSSILRQRACFIKNVFFLTLLIPVGKLSAQLSVTGSATSPNACPPYNVTLSATSTGASGTPVYLWSVSSGFLSGFYGQHVTLTTDSTVAVDTIIVTCTDGQHSAADTFFFRSNAIFGFTIHPPSNNGEVCINDTLKLRATSGYQTYRWSDGSMDSFTVARNFRDTVTVYGTLYFPVYYTVTVTNSYGCTASADLTVTPVDTPSLSTTPSPVTLCNGQ